MYKHHKDLYNSLVSCAWITNNWQRAAQKGREKNPAQGGIFTVDPYFGAGQVETVKLEDCPTKLYWAFNWLFDQ